MAKNKTLEAIVSIAGQLDPSLSKSLNSASKQFSGMKLGMAAVGTAAVAATAALVKFGADAVKSAAEFETQMANVSTLLDGTEEQVKKRTSELSDEVLAVSNSTGVATGELSDGLYQIISAVGDSDDAIAQMELAAKAAAAGGAETTDAINLLTAVTKGYGDTSAEAFQKASDLSFMTVKLGQTSFPELASSMGKVVPLASALGVSQEELYGSFAALTGVTGSTAEVATQMKAVMSGLMSPSKGMTDALKQLGYENANVALESLGLQGTLDALGETVGGDTQQLAKMFSSVEAQTAILALAGAQSEDFADKTAAMYDATGATQTAFERQTDTLEYTIQMIKNLGQNFMTNIGRKILPVVKSVAEKVLPMIEQGLDQLDPILTGIYEALSPVIEQVGDFVGGILPKLSDVLNFLTGLWEKFSPIMQTLADNIFPVFNIIFEAWCDLFDDLSPVIGDFVDNLLPAIGSLIEGLMPIIQVLAQAIKPIFEMIGQMVKALLPALTSVINFLVPVISGLASVFASVLGSVLEYIMPIVQQITDVFVALMDFIMNVFQGNWSAAWESMKSLFGNAFQALVSLCKMPMNSVISIINGAISGINGLGLTIPDWVPIVGGKNFSIDIPTIPLLASGGFTQGPSIAGEAGTEAVISFDSAYRDENLSYWAKAGRMLGVDDSLLTAFESGVGGGSGMNITFSPQITINGTSSDTKADIINALKQEEEEFMDMLADMFARKGGDGYGFGY